MACAELSNHPVFWGIDHDEALIRKGEKERAVQPEYVPYLMELSTEPVQPEHSQVQKR